MSHTESAGDVVQALESMNPSLHPDATSGPLCIVLSPSSIRSWLVAQRAHQVCSFYQTNRNSTVILTIFIPIFHESILAGS